MATYKLVTIEDIYRKIPDHHLALCLKELTEHIKELRKKNLYAGKAGGWSLPFGPLLWSDGESACPACKAQDSLTHGYSNDTLTPESECYLCQKCGHRVFSKEGREMGLHFDRTEA